jgi:hypothetical protein
MMKMTRLALLAATAALICSSSAYALGGSGYAQISANWATPGVVHVTVLSNHSFHGSVNTTCGTAVNATQSLDNWVFNQVTHQNEDKLDFDISAAGSGANCTITVNDGHKVLAQQSFVSA